MFDVLLLILSDLLTRESHSKSNRFKTLDKLIHAKASFYGGLKVAVPLCNPAYENFNEETTEIIDVALFYNNGFVYWLHDDQPLNRYETGIMLQVAKDYGILSV